MNLNSLCFKVNHNNLFSMTLKIKPVFLVASLYGMNYVWDQLVNFSVEIKTIFHNFFNLENKYILLGHSIHLCKGLYECLVL